MKGRDHPAAAAAVVVETCSVTGSSRLRNRLDKVYDI